MATVLIVDDLEANRALLVTLLRYQGHHLIEAANGREGLAAARGHHPDIVITDVLMPVMDGYEFVRQLRMDPTTRRIPVVFYTAHYGEREARALALSSGVSFVLTKPAEPEDVLKIVGRVLSGESETGARPDEAALPLEFDREHLRLVTDKLSEKASDLKTANARLRALINISLELASERDADRLMRSVCESARELFGATYASLGIMDRDHRTLERFVSAGAEGTADWTAVGDTAPELLATVVSERRAYRGANPSGDPAALKLPLAHPPIVDYLIAPVASPAHVYGWISLVANEGRHFTDEDEELVIALAGQVGRIYENGHFYRVAREERDRAQRYLDTAGGILLALDTEGRITMVNRYACTLLGWTADELIGRRWVDTCLPRRVRDLITQQFNQLLAGDLAVVENPVVARSGKEHLIEWHNTVLEDEAGTVIGTLSSGIDVTERNQAIEALRTAEERVRFALTSANVGIWDMDYTTGVLQWSETLEAHYGLGPGTFGGTFEEFIALTHPDDRQSLLDAVGVAMKGGRDFIVENRALWSDGTVRWLTGAGRIIVDASGSPVRGVGISLDVTERHKLEAQFQQAQKMEAVGRLAGGVAHDFNNLLTVILGYCEFMLGDMAPDDPRLKDVAEVQKAGQSAAALTKQLLAFSRKQIIEPVLLDLNTVISELRPMLGRLIGEDVRVLLGLRAGSHPVIADRGQIEQIVLNLAVNARDAMPGGGTLTIETANVDLDEHYAHDHFAVAAGPYVALTVSDTGTGMSPEVQARLFEPFFTTKEVGKGTGLGLATVHGIVSRSGGTVNVYSEVGKGTSFKVYFPRANGGEEAVELQAPVARTRGGPETILIVEDAEGLRELTRRLLERQGYTVLAAANANEALSLFEANPSIDLLLTDVVMPGASGPELTRQLVERRPGLKVLYMSGYTEETIVNHGVLQSGIAFLHKPFTSETIGRRVREVLDR
jgi:PAS domain S-box-containing protein